jgi:hypothetical protein
MIYTITFQYAEGEKIIINMKKEERDNILVVLPAHTCIDCSQIGIYNDKYSTGTV